MLDVRPIPAFTDNYIWLITSPNDKRAFVVDPGDGQVVRDTLESEGLELAGILVTHHHFDHVLGVSVYEEEGATVVRFAIDDVVGTNVKLTNDGAPVVVPLDTDGANVVLPAPATVGIVVVLVVAFDEIAEGWLVTLDEIAEG